MSTGQKENRGRFKRGEDARRHKFTRAECLAGYEAALDAIITRTQLGEYYAKRALFQRMNRTECKRDGLEYVPPPRKQSFRTEQKPRSETERPVNS